jgi:lipoyl(octanoyl) transferase
MRGGHETHVVVHRPGPGGAEFLILLRSPEKQGYWNLVAGGVEERETPEAAALRELGEEVALAPVGGLLELGDDLGYDVADEPPEVQARFAPDVVRVQLHAYSAAAPPGWEPTLNEEHVAYRWADEHDALKTLRYEEPREAVRRAARALSG